VSGPACGSGQVNTWLGLLAVLTCVTLVLTALRPGLAVSLVIFSWPALAVRTGSPPVRRSASGYWANGGLGLRRHQHLESLAREAVVLAACAATEVVPPAAGVAVGGRSVPLRPAQRRGTRSAPGVSHREYLLPGHQTGAIRGTQDQLTRMNLPLPPAVVGGRRANTAKARRVIVARQSPFSARQITRCRRIARNSALDTEDELK
jgi:hypothetical protein